VIALIKFLEEQVYEGWGLGGVDGFELPIRKGN
jgi:hypothetical protein